MFESEFDGQSGPRTSHLNYDKAQKQVKHETGLSYTFVHEGEQPRQIH